MIDHSRKKTRVAAMSVISNSTLVVFKLIVGLYSGAVSILSEAIHSGVDLVAALIAFFAVRAAGKPADEEHTFGHGKFENLSAAIEGLLIFVAAGWIIYESISKLIFPEPVDNLQWGIIVMGISAITNLIISRKLFKVGKETDSAALMADAWHLRTDVWTSAGVSVGLAMYMLGKLFMPEINLEWIDPVIAMGVAGLIVKAAWELTSEAVTYLLDASLPKEEENAITMIIDKMAPRVLNFHNFKTRKAGSERFVEFHLVVNKDLTVKQAHDICDDITIKIKAQFPKTEVMIHTEPCLDQCGGHCKGSCAIFEA
ncbi:MAG: cation diffusion facilitator family transporter [Bacteroidales bacterium]